jgi:hypothetical protein
LILDGNSAEKGVFMPFDYLHCRIPLDFQEKIKNRFTEMHMNEIKEKSALLYNLRYTKEKSIKRIRQNIEWEFELSTIPAFYEQVDSIVSEVYRHKERGK